MAKRGISLYVVPTADFHESEYVGAVSYTHLSYNANVDDMQKALKLAKEDAADNDVPFYRVEDTGRLNKNDGTRYGYASGTQFSSLMNINVSHFYQDSMLVSIQSGTDS